MQPLTATARDTVRREQQDRPQPHNEGADRQAERAGPPGPKALGIKAEWPRLAEAWGAAREPDGGTTGRPRVSAGTMVLNGLRCGYTFPESVSMASSDVVRARIDKEIKEEASHVLSEWGCRFRMRFACR